MNDLSDEFEKPSIQLMRAVATGTFAVSPPLYYVIKALAYRAHQRYRDVIQDEPGVDWAESKHKAALDKVYRY